MLTPRFLLCAGLLAGLMLAPAEAQARFGKRSSSSRGKDSNNERRGGSRVHDATPVGQESSGNDDDDHCCQGGSDGGSAVVGAVGFLLDVFLAPAPPPSTYVVVSPPPPPPQRMQQVEVQADAYEPEVPLWLRLGINGGEMSEGAAATFFAAVEGERLGVSMQGTSLALPADDGSDDLDRIGLMEAHLTVALWSAPRGRLRVEGGLASARAPDVTFVGPSLAASMEACLVGSLDFEARVQTVPFPYRQLDAQAGLSLHLGAFQMRGGWRALVLDDAGHVDGVRHVDALGGPYFGLGLLF